MAASRNQGSTRRDIKRLRNDSDSNTSPMGYEDGAGVPQAVEGDEEAPFLKTPPFPTQATRWFRNVNVFDTEWLFTDPIDVAKRRLLTVWILFNSDAAPGPELLFIPYAAHAPRPVTGGTIPEDFYAITVVDPTLTRVVDTVAPFAAVGAGIVLGRRDMMETMPRPYDNDPLWTVMQEGGPMHTWGALEDYCKRLEETGRAVEAARLREKFEGAYRHA